MKVKELVVDPGKSLSMQRHEHRSEHWIVSEGTAVVNSKHPDTGALITQTLEKHETYDVAAGTWHQLTNPFKVPLKLVEVQYGVRCVEEDITRDN
jgi:mannose-6-phosphate isomerase-like protein (cupin superfamily)